jgi:hypothetical protein
MYFLDTVVAAADKTREAVVQVQDLVLWRNLRDDGEHYTDRDGGTESGQFADVHGTIRIPDTAVRMVLQIEIEGEID